MEFDDRFHIAWVSGATNVPMSDICPYSNEIKLKAFDTNGFFPKLMGEKTVPLNKNRELTKEPRLMIPKNYGVVDHWYTDTAMKHVQTFPDTFETGKTLYGKMRTVYPIFLIDHTGAAIKYKDDDGNDQIALQLETTDQYLTVGELRQKSDRLKDASGCVFVKGFEDISIDNHITMNGAVSDIYLGDAMDNLMLQDVTEAEYLMFLFPDDVTIDLIARDPVSGLTVKIATITCRVYS